MTEPIFDTTTERLYARLPDVMRASDVIFDYPLKRYLSGVGDILSEVDRLVARFSYLHPEDRPTPDKVYEPFSQYTKKVRGAVRDTIINRVVNPVPSNTSRWRTSRVSGGITDDRWLRLTATQTDGSQYGYPDLAASGEGSRFPVAPGDFVAARVTVRNPNSFTIRSRISIGSYLWNGTTFDNALGTASGTIYTLNPGEEKTIEVIKPTAWSEDGTHILPIVYLLGATENSAALGAMLDVRYMNLFIHQTVLSSPLPNVIGSFQNTVGETYTWNGVVNNSTSTMVIYETPTVLIDGSTSDLVDGEQADLAWLPWLTQLVGADYNELRSEEEVRNAITSGSGGYRAGSYQAIIDAVKSELTGTKYAAIYKNSNATDPIGTASMFEILIVTKYSETPGFAQIVETVTRKQAKPAGVQLFHRTFEAAWQDVEAVAPTIADWESRTWAQIEEIGFN